jgi:acyl-CoA synthetase (AMP-forming)/AMP-acid ligase II
MEKRTYPEFSTHYPLLLTTFMKRPVKIYPNEIGVVYRNQATGEYQRFTWLEWYKRTCRLANALNTLGIKTGKPGDPGERVATMALNTHRHLELYYAAPCIGAMLHPINVRLALDHIVYTILHAGDKVIFFDDLFMPMVEAIYDQIKDTVDKFVYMSDKPGLPDSKIKKLCGRNQTNINGPTWMRIRTQHYATQQPQPAFPRVRCLPIGLCISKQSTFWPTPVLVMIRQLRTLERMRSP